MTSDENGPTPSRLSLPDRLLLFVEREGNRRLRPLGTALFRRRRGRIGPGGREVLLLTTRGRKTGREHTVLLQGFPDGADTVLVASNSGRPVPPHWLLNLRAMPSATVEFRGRAFEVRAEELADAEADAFWPRVLRIAPSYERYQRAAGRRPPLVRLVTIAATVDAERA